MKCAECPYKNRIEERRKNDREYRSEQRRRRMNKGKDRALLV